MRESIKMKTNDFNFKFNIQLKYLIYVILTNISLIYNLLNQFYYDFYWN